jgi:hypothetical protein
MLQDDLNTNNKLGIPTQDQGRKFYAWKFHESQTELRWLKTNGNGC